MGLDMYAYSVPARLSKGKETEVKLAKMLAALPNLGERP